MSSERKTIKINPDLFKIDTSNTKKNRKSTNSKEIRVKSNERNNKTLKRSLLKFIRNRQQESLSKVDENKIPQVNDTSNFKSDFKESLDYLTKIANENKQKNANSVSGFHNNTLKRHYSSNNIPVLQIPNNAGSLSPVTIPIVEMNSQPMSIKSVIPSLYGCLKGGQLPTYRTYISQMNKSNMNNNIAQTDYQVNPNNNTFTNNVTGQIHQHQEPQNYQKQSIVQSNIQTSIPDISDKKDTTPDLSNIPYNAKNMIKDNDIKKAYHLAETHKKLGGNQKKMRNIPKQKKTLRRTFYIGKSKVFPKISVLVSNKTIRNNITNKSMKIRQTPVTEVKRYLIKKGFIKVGSIAPPDVLRKMYESALLMCGEIQNHNPDNLLYNYLNGGEDSNNG